MHFGAVRPVADVAVDPAYLRHSVGAPAGVADRFAGEIDRIVADLLAILKRPLRAPERAAAQVSLEPLPRKAVLHLPHPRPPKPVDAQTPTVPSAPPSLNLFAPPPVPA